jgi:fatty-acyl-CoA synthase
LIIRGGHNIDPKLIEEPLHRHPAVALAAAIGRPDSRAGETPVLYVQLKAGATASEMELLEYANAHIPERAAHPKSVKILQAMPVTAVGKIFKPALSMMEIADVVRAEAGANAAQLTFVDVMQDARRGLVARVGILGASGGRRCAA